MQNVIQMNSGNMINLDDLSQNEYKIHDVIYSLSNTIRFNGHLDYSYTVSQHCILMHDYFDWCEYPVDVCALALLHDCEESITGDIPTPIKNCIPGARELGDRIRQSMFNYWGISFSQECQELVKKLDADFVFHEKNIYFRSPQEWPLESDRKIYFISKDESKKYFDLNVWNAQSAYSIFLSRLDRLEKRGFKLNIS